MTADARMIQRRRAREVDRQRRTNQGKMVFTAHRRVLFCEPVESDVTTLLETARYVSMIAN